MRDFISWTRFSEYEDDMPKLYLLKNEAVIEAQKRR